MPVFIPSEDLEAYNKCLSEFQDWQTYLEEEYDSARKKKLLEDATKGIQPHGWDL